MNKKLYNELVDNYVLIIADGFANRPIENQRNFIRNTINLLCEFNNIPPIDKITFSNVDDDLGSLSSNGPQININLENLLQLPEFPYNVLDTIIHEVKHYEQYYTSKDPLIQLGLEGALPPDDKDYMSQKHEIEAYDHTLKQLYKLAKDLKHDGLKKYVDERSKTVAEMRGQNKKSGIFNFFGKNKEYDIVIEKQKESKEFNEAHNGNLSQYNTTDIVTKTDILMDVKLDSGGHSTCNLEMKENSDYFEADMYRCNIGGSDDKDNILQIYAKGNNSAIMVNGSGNDNIIKGAVELAETIIHFYKE